MSASDNMHLTVSRVVTELLFLEGFSLQEYSTRAVPKYVRAHALGSPDPRRIQVGETYTLDVVLNVDKGTQDIPTHFRRLAYDTEHGKAVLNAGATIFKETVSPHPFPCKRLELHFDIFPNSS